MRVVILTGAGERAFIGGADIREMAGLDRTTASAFIARLHRACLALRSLRVPVIARIRGYCLGAGLELAVSCDMIIGTEGSSYGLPHMRIGIASIVEAAILPQAIGIFRTKELCFTADFWDGKKAKNVESITKETEKNRLG